MQSGSKARRGFSLLELAVVVVIISLLAATLLERVLYYQEQAEHVAVLQTLGVMRTAMHLQMADSLLHPVAKPMARLDRANPMDWLAEKPPNYLGEFTDPKPDQIAAGNWYFDDGNRTLVYLPNFHGNLQTSPGQGNKLVFRTRLSYLNSVRYAGSSGNANGNDTFEGVVLEPVKPYKWF